MSARQRTVVRPAGRGLSITGSRRRVGGDRSFLASAWMNHRLRPNSSRSDVGDRRWRNAISGVIATRTTRGHGRNPPEARRGRDERATGARWAAQDPRRPVRPLGAGRRPAGGVRRTLRQSARASRARISRPSAPARHPATPCSVDAPAKRCSRDGRPSQSRRRQRGTATSRLRDHAGATRHRRPEIRRRLTERATKRVLTPAPLPKRRPHRDRATAQPPERQASRAHPIRHARLCGDSAHRVCDPPKSNGPADAAWRGRLARRVDGPSAAPQPRPSPRGPRARRRAENDAAAPSRPALRPRADAR